MARQLIALILVGSLGAITARPALAQPVDHPVLRKVWEAHRKLRYSGTRTVEFQRDGKITSFRERRFYDQGKLRIEFLSGWASGQVLVDDGRDRIIFMPGGKEARIFGSMPEPPFDRWDWRGGGRGRGERRGGGGGGARPKIEVAEGNSVAGRRTRVLAISNPEGRLLARMWVDRDRAFILKRESYGADGRWRSRFTYQSIAFAPRFQSDTFAPDRRGVRIIRPIDDLRAMAAKMDLSPITLPGSTGYELVGVRKLDRGKKGMLLTLYGQAGREPLSLFLVQGEIDVERLKAASGGRVNAHVWTVGETTCVLVGALEVEKLRELARASG